MTAESHAYFSSEVMARRRLVSPQAANPLDTAWVVLNVYDQSSDTVRLGSAACRTGEQFSLPVTLTVTHPIKALALPSWPLAV